MSSFSRPAAARRGVNAYAMADRKESADFDGALVVLSGGTRVIESYAGLADHQTREPCAAQTRFQLASVSKQFSKTKKPG